LRFRLYNYSTLKLIEGLQEEFMINIAFSLSTVLGSFIFYYQSDKIL